MRYERLKDSEGGDFQARKKAPKGKIGKPKTKDVPVENLDRDTWTYNRFNPWNLMGREGITGKDGSNDGWILDSVEQFMNECPVRSEASDMYMKDALNQMDKDHWPFGHSWMYALQCGYAPPVPSSKRLGNTRYNFLLKCFEKDRHKRPTATQLLQDEYITGEAQIVLDQQETDSQHIEPNSLKRTYSNVQKRKQRGVGFLRCPDQQNVTVNNRSIKDFVIGKI